MFPSNSHYLSDMRDICQLLSSSLGFSVCSLGRGRVGGLYLFLTKQKGVQREGVVMFFLFSVPFLSSSIPELDGVNHVSGLIPIGVLRPGEARRGEIKMKGIIDS
jgi:hypothetical protein